MALTLGQMAPSMSKIIKTAPNYSEWKLAFMSARMCVKSPIRLGVDARLVALALAPMIEVKGWIAVTDEVADEVALRCLVQPVAVSQLAEEVVLAGWLTRSGPALTLSVP